MYSEFAEFQPLPSSPSTILYKTLEENNKKLMRENLIKSLGDVRELKSDYLGMSSFYYSRKADIIYELDNSRVCLVKPSFEVEERIRKINNL